MEALKKLICLNCGGDVVVSADGKSATCKYCKRTYRIGSTLSDSTLIAFSFATEYWKNFRFTDAKRKFAEVTKANPEFSEAWWGAFVSEYGIEFGENRMGEKVPTCHRAHTVDVRSDENYRRALETASEEDRAEWEELGEKIERVRRGIIKKSDDGENYDVFICFKATEIEPPHNKTSDYFLGRDIYYELTKAGYKVFFSSETLGQISEQEYEPYIFKALTTARVMLVLCSNNEKIESAWVKNEWGRYLDMRGGKGLIPVCGNNETRYNAYLLPEDLRKLNAIEYDGKLFEKLKTKIEAYFPERVKAREEAAKKAKEAEYESRFAKERKEREALAALEREEQEKRLKEQQEELARLKEIMASLQSNAAKSKEPSPESDAMKREQEELLKKQREELTSLKEMMANLQSNANKQSVGASTPTMTRVPVSSTSVQTAADTSSGITLNADDFIVKNGVLERIKPMAMDRIAPNKSKPNEKLKIAVVNFPDDVTEIPGDIFWHMHFGKINFGKNLKIIGKNAFSYSHFDSPVVIPDSVTEIGEDAFEKSEIKNGLTLGKGLNVIGSGAFDKSTLTKIDIPDSVTKIGWDAFSACKNLKEVTLGKRVKEIGARAFQETSIATITIPDSVETIMVDAFYSCKNLQEVSLGKGIKTIGQHAFSLCGALKKVNLLTARGMNISDNVFAYTPYKNDVDHLMARQGGNFELSGEVFANITLAGFAKGRFSESVVVPECVVYIKEKAFYDSKVEEVFIGENVQEIGENAFPDDAKITIDAANPNKAAFERAFLKQKEGAAKRAKEAELSRFKFGRGANGKTLKGFANQSDENSATSLTVPEGVREIAPRAFSGCALEEVILPDSVERIGEKAFSKCKRLKKVVWSMPLTFLGECAFEGCAFEELRLPSGCARLEICDGAFRNCKDLTSVVFGDNVTRIAAETFLNCKKLANVAFGDKAEVIGQSAFAGCAMRELKLPHSVTVIESHAFEACLNLTNITWSRTLQEIGESAFTGCKSIRELKLPEYLDRIRDYAFKECQNLTKVTFGWKTRAIGFGAFYGTAITELNLPDGVESMAGITGLEFGPVRKLVLGKCAEDISPNSSDKVGFTVDRIVLSKDNPNFCMKDGVLYDRDCTKLIATSRKDLGATVVIPDSVTAIFRNTFANCGNVQEVTLPSNLEYIDDRCFQETSPKIVKLRYHGLFAPKWVKEIFANRKAHPAKIVKIK